MKGHSSASLDWFEKFKDGDPEVMKGIVRSYHKRLIGYVRLITRDEGKAEEIAQEVFLAAYLQRNEIRRAESLRPWLFTVAKRKAMREMRKRSRLEEIAIEDETLDRLFRPENPEQGNRAVLHQFGRILGEAIQSLSPRDREILVLRYFGDLQIKEISEITGIPMGSIGVFLKRILEKLRKHFERNGVRPEDFFPES